MKCDACGRTGFTSDELVAHAGGKRCQTPMTAREIKETIFNAKPDRHVLAEKLLDMEARHKKELDEAMAP